MPPIRRCASRVRRAEQLPRLRVDQSPVDSEASILWSLLFGSAGLGFLIYGRRQRMLVPLVCGLALMVYPYFVSSTVLLVLIGVILVTIPYFVRM